MKKIFAIFTVLALLVGGLFASYTDSGTLTVYGEIVAGDLEFKVYQELDENEPVDLLNDESIKLDGSGYQIGYWTFKADNQEVGGSTFDLTYQYSPLSLGGSNTISIVLLEVDPDSENGTTVHKISGAVTKLTTAEGDNSYTRNILFKLTAEGVNDLVGKPASDEYQSVVTLTIVKN